MCAAVDHSRAGSLPQEPRRPQHLSLAADYCGSEPAREGLVRCLHEQARSHENEIFMHILIDSPLTKSAG